MKDWKDKGIRTRVLPEYRYSAAWNNLKTTRFSSPLSLKPDKSEFYDVSITSRCNLECPFCYVSASHKGKDYTNICEKALFFFGNMDDNSKPFQIAIGSEGEPTIHPEFIRFLETIYKLNIVPNFTTNGLTIANNDSYSKELLDAAEKYCAGVAVSANTYNNTVWTKWNLAVDKLLQRDVYVNLHIVVSDSRSIRNLKMIYDTYKDVVHTFVILPLMKNGRSNECMSIESFNELRKFYGECDDVERLAFGANMYRHLISQEDNGLPFIKCNTFEPEMFSKNLILDDTIRITPSSFDTKTTLCEIVFNQ